MMDKKIVIFCLYGLITIFIISSVVSAASFDCSKAKTKTEKAICDDPLLSIFDEVMADVYNQALNTPRRDAVRKRQRKWLKEILAPCNGDKECIKKAYEDRFRQLDYDIESQKPTADDYSDQWVQSYARDTRICKKAYKLIEDAESCRPFDNIMCWSIDISSIHITDVLGKPPFVFEEIATNEYGYTSVYRSINSSLNGFAIIYVERYQGERYPRLVETWKVDTSDLDEVMKLQKRYEMDLGFADPQIEKNASEFAEMLKRGEKLTNEWSPVIDIFGEPYLIERECIGLWAEGGFYACEKAIKLTIKKLIKDKKTAPYCQFSKAKKKNKQKGP